MQAMLLKQQNSELEFEELQIPALKSDEVLIAVECCGVCRTDLHVHDGDLKHPKLPLVLGHEVVGRIVAAPANSNLATNQRVGVAWLANTCGVCKFCTSNRENLCDAPNFTGYTVNGGYATNIVAHKDFCYPLPNDANPEEIAPLLCAGLIGWRTLKMAGDAKRIGIYGFGAAAHIIVQVAVYQGRDVYAFTKPGDKSTQEFARNLGAVWAGGSDELPPEKLDAALIFAPAGELIPLALKASDKGATIVSGGIHMSDIPAFPYSILWEERSIKSVANLTREDAKEFFDIAFKIPIKTNVHVYDLKNANQALADLRNGAFNGAAVLKVASGAYR